jgi:hypothetical protein
VASAPANNLKGSEMKMHWCRASVDLVGRGLTTVVYDETRPISWPEAQVIMATHGEENISGIKPVSIGETTAGAEKERLARKYGYKAVESVFPGRSFRMELLMPAESEPLPLADEYGVPTDKIAEPGNGRPIEEPPAPTPPPQPAPSDDEDEEEDAKPGEPPIGPAVFKAGRHRPPATKGA